MCVTYIFATHNANKDTEKRFFSFIHFQKTIYIFPQYICCSCVFSFLFPLTTKCCLSLELLCNLILMIFNKYSLCTSINLSKGKKKYSPIHLNRGILTETRVFFTLQSQDASHSLSVLYEIRTVNIEKCNLLSSVMISGFEL